MPWIRTPRCQRLCRELAGSFSASDYAPQTIPPFHGAVPAYLHAPMARSAASNRWLKITAWTVGILAILAVAGILIGQAWMDRYLRSAEFHAEIEKRAGISLRAKIAIEPI